MRLILFFLLLSLGAEAQIIRANAFYKPTAVVNLLLDDYPNAQAAYGLRKLRTAYSGNAIRVRRDSTGNAETDIGFLSDGHLDTNAIKNHCRNNNCAVTTWYDQSTNGRNVTQTTAANQPRIATSGTINRRSGNLAIVFDGTNDNLFNTATGFAVNNVSQYAVSSRGNTSNTLRTVFSTGILSITNGFGFYYADGAQQDKIYQQIRNLTTTIISIGDYTNTLNSNNLIFGIGTSLTDYTYFNSGDEKTQNHTRSSVNSNQRLSIGCNYFGTTASQFLNGTVTEVVFWGTNQSSNRTGIETNINNYYGIW